MCGLASSLAANDQVVNAAAAAVDVVVGLVGSQVELDRVVGVTPVARRRAAGKDRVAVSGFWLGSLKTGCAA